MSHDTATTSVLSGSLEPETDAALHKKIGWGFWIAVSWVIVITLLAILAPYIHLRDPRGYFVELNGSGRPPYGPSFKHWFGTDKDARDVFSRTLYGARISLIVGFSAISFGFLVGGTLGIIAGYFRGWLDKIISFTFIILLSFPSLVLAIMLTALLNRSLFTISMILGILSIAPVGRLARASTLQFSDREFILAARQIGASDSRIIFRELLPNVVIPMSALALLGVAVAIVAEGGLAFLGLSVSQGITWGSLIQIGSDSATTLENAPWIAFFPILLLFLTVLSLNFAGDRLRSHLDVKESSL